MANATIGTNNCSWFIGSECMDGAAIAGPADANFPIDRLLGGKNIWRFTGTTADITVTFPQPITARFMALCATNLSQGAAVRYRVGTQYDTGDMPAFPTTVYEDCGPDWERRSVEHRLDTSLTDTEWRITVQDPTGAGFISALRFIAGEPFAQVDISDGYSVSVAESGGTNERSLSGAKHTGHPVRFRELSLSTQNMTNDAGLAFMRRELSQGTAQELYASVVPDTDDEVAQGVNMLCTFSRLERSTRRARFDRWSKPFRLSELF